MPPAASRSPAGPPVEPAPRPRRSRRLLAWTWPLLAALALGTIGGVGVAAAIHMPRVDAIADFTPSLVTQLFDRRGEAFFNFARERRVMLKENEIPRVLRQAVLASEDSNFYQHGGIDAAGIVRAELANLRQGRIVEGASTITMQLARTLFLSREKKWRRKIEEAFLAVELEKTFSKQQILTLYLNLVNLGHGNYGVEAASRYYFDKPAAQLTLAEAATLVGIIPAPSRYSPYRAPAKVLAQRDRVLRRMLDEGLIQPRQHRAAVEQPLLVATRRTEQAFAPYFAEEVRKHLEATYGATSLYEGGLQVQTTLDPAIQRAADRAVQEGLRRLDHRRGWRGPLAVLDAAGLESQKLPTWSQGEPVPGRWYQGIVLESDADAATVKIGDHTYTLDREGIRWTGRTAPSSVLERGAVAWFRIEEPEKPKDAASGKGKDEAEEKPAAADKPLRIFLEQEPRMEAAAVVIESRTGAVRAMVGGWGFERNKFNRITQAKRQVGSAFKPFVYGAAIESGWTPADTLLDAPTYFRGADGRMSYAPQNYYKKYYGIVTLRRALELSINVATVKLMDVVGTQRVIDFARRCGIKAALPPYPSMALGSADLTPLELAAAFAAIANQGTYLEPYWIERVGTREGQVLEQHFPNAHSATDPATAFVLTHMMEGVIDHGTAYEAHDLPIDAAGKTGTTDDFSDAWFVGYTPRYTILTWTGYDVKRSLGSGMSGAVAALPMWISIVKAGLDEGWLEKGEKFEQPANVNVQKVEYYTGLRPGPGSYRTVEEAFVTGTEPYRDYSAKWSTVMSLPWYQQRSFYVPKEGEEMTERSAVPGADGAEAPPPTPGPADEAPEPPLTTATEAGPGQ